MNNLNALDYARMGADTIMKRFTVEELPPVKRFHYHQGVFLAGVERVYELTNDEKYKRYIKDWVDINVDENGDSESCVLTVFDDIQPAILLFDIYNETHDERYKKMLDRLFREVEMWPTNAKGGVWHMKFMDNQMWLDCMYMMGLFSAMYAKQFNVPYMFEKIYTQVMLMRRYMTEPNDEENWTESSCTALFTYAMAKCLRKGIIDSSFEENVVRGYNGVLSKI